MKRATIRNEFGSPPASTDHGYQACNMGYVGRPRRSYDALQLQPHPRGRRRCPHSRNSAGPQRFCLYAASAPRGYRDLCQEIRFGRPSLLFRLDLGHSPDFRVSFVLRDPGHIKAQLSRFGVGRCSEQKPPQ
jgi:hypothetical protein